MAKYIEYINGMVNKIPIQKPTNPKAAKITASTINPKSNKGCFKINLTLIVSASVAFRSEKIIKGIVRNVKKATT